MKKCKSLINTLIFKVILVTALFVVVPFWNVSFADGDHEDMEHPIGSCYDAILGDHRCWVEESPDTSWIKPLIKITYKTSYFGFEVEDSETLGIGECGWVTFFALPIRVCARMAKAGSPKYPGDYEYDERDGPGTGRNACDDDVNGNKTGCTKSPRPQLCGYEDPMDGMDSGMTSPFHHLTDRKEAAQMRDSALFGVLSLGITNLVGGIMSKYNHVVIRDLGCVDRPIGPIPPPFCNECWKTHYLPSPEISEGQGSTFLEPKVQVKVCEDLEGKPSLCDINGAIEIEPRMRDLSPVAPSYEDCENAPDGRRFCAQITLTEPDKICVYNKILPGPPAKSVNDFMGCIPRSGYMYKPEVEFTGTTSGAGNTFIMGVDTPQMTVKLGEQSVTLSEDPGIYAEPPVIGAGRSNSCAFMHQIEFCLSRECLDGGRVEVECPPLTPEEAVAAAEAIAEAEAAGLPPPVPPKCYSYECKQWSDDVCVTGYDTPPVVVKNSSGDIVASTPNTMVFGEFPFKNKQANQENGEYIDMELPVSTWIYDPQKCFRFNEEGNYCENYSGRCNSEVGSGPPDWNIAGDECLNYKVEITSASDDPYAVDISVGPEGCEDDENVDCKPNQSISPLPLDVMGMCIKQPVDSTVKVFSNPGTYNYTVEDGCTIMQAEVIGGGAAGISKSGDSDVCETNYAGGSGARGKWHIPVEAGQNIIVKVGSGGNDRGTAGQASQISHGSNAVGAGGGYGQKGVCDQQGCRMGNQGLLMVDNWEGAQRLEESRDGTGGLCNWSVGADGPDGGSSAYYCAVGVRSSTPGAGGCTRDNRENSANGDKFQWEKGGHGMVKLRCVSGGLLQ